MLNSVIYFVVQVLHVEGQITAAGGAWLSDCTAKASISLQMNKRITFATFSNFCRFSATSCSLICTRKNTSIFTSLINPTKTHTTSYQASPLLLISSKCCETSSIMSPSQVMCVCQHPKLRNIQ